MHKFDTLQPLDFVFDVQLAHQFLVVTRKGLGLRFEGRQLLKEVRRQDKALFQVLIHTGLFLDAGDIGQPDFDRVRQRLR